MFEKETIDRRDRVPEIRVAAIFALRKLNSPVDGCFKIRRKFAFFIDQTEQRLGRQVVEKRVIGRLSRSAPKS